MSEIIKVRKSYEGLTIVLPKEICERLNIVEGSQLDIEPYNSSGEFGARIKLNKWYGDITGKHDWETLLIVDMINYIKVRVNRNKCYKEQLNNRCSAKESVLN